MHTDKQHMKVYIMHTILDMLKTNKNVYISCSTCKERISYYTRNGSGLDSHVRCQILILGFQHCERVNREGSEEIVQICSINALTFAACIFANIRSSNKACFSRKYNIQVLT